MPPSPVADRKSNIREALITVAKTATCDLSAKPWIAGPRKDINGLPVGLTLTGRHFDNATVLRAGHTYEQD